MAHSSSLAALAILAAVALPPGVLARSRSAAPGPPAGAFHGSLAPLVSAHDASAFQCREDPSALYFGRLPGRAPYRDCETRPRVNEPWVTLQADADWLVVGLHEFTPALVGTDSARHAQLREDWDRRLGRGRTCADGRSSWSGRDWWASLSPPMRPTIEGAGAGSVRAYAQIQFDAKLIGPGDPAPACR
jgi:hypothetical protein